MFHRETRKLLGIHMIGELASELLHLGSIAMNLGVTVDIFTENVFNFPTLAEAYLVAAWNDIEQRENDECSLSAIGQMVHPILSAVSHFFFWLVFLNRDRRACGVKFRSFCGFRWFIRSCLYIQMRFYRPLERHFEGPKNAKVQFKLISN